VTDGIAAINAAIKQGARCVAGPAGQGGCASSTTSPAMVYFSAGTYLSKISWITTHDLLLLEEPMLKYSIDHLVTNSPILYDTYPW
jgi:glucan 1,3-beta-glucosidase